MMSNLKDTIPDAQIMFNFMRKVINKNLTELTLMCEERYLHYFKQENSYN